MTNMNIDAIDTVDPIALESVLGGTSTPCTEQNIDKPECFDEKMRRFRDYLWSDGKR